MARTKETPEERHIAPIPQLEKFELVPSPVTLNGWCYKGATACIDIGGTGLLVTITAVDATRLEQALNLLVPEDAPYKKEWFKTTIGQYEHLPRPTDDFKVCYEVGYQDGMSWVKSDSLADCLAEQPEDEPLAVFIFANSEPIYRWHVAKKMWRPLT